MKKTVITASRKPEISIVPGNCFWELDFVAGALQIKISLLKITTNGKKKKKKRKETGFGNLYVPAN